MFYSQFILAKKGPLGTIWIAAHLERKLRKNQVADTDIGVSVDSILFPDVPIALRLSSHLLLGVVRIYSRKVNYLFDDCSEALLKIKQAFRSTAVDLPPEESTAPYHSITLPETFDLDDFELPDNEIFQGNYVDHHVSSREQITLQDTMDGVVYSTSQFGLDERFGDGDTSQIGLLDEELVLDRVASSKHAEVSEYDPQGSDVPQEQVPSNSEAMPMDCSGDQVEDLAANSEFIDYDQDPGTPGLVEVPNLSGVHEALAGGDHAEPEHDDLTELANAKCVENASNKSNLHHEDNNPLDQSLENEINHDAVVIEPPENDCHISDMEKEQNKPQESSLPDAVSVECASAVGTVRGPDGSDRVEEMHNGGLHSIDRTDRECAESPSCSNVTFDLDEPARRTSSNSTCVPVSDGNLENDQALQKFEFGNEAEATGNLEESHGKAIASNPSCPLESPSRPTVIDGEAQAFQEPNISENLKETSIHEEVSSVQFLGSNNLAAAEQNSVDLSQREEEVHASGAPIEVQGEVCQTQMLEPAFCGHQLENSNSCAMSDLPAPERLLSAPEVLLDKPSDLLVESTPDKEILAGNDEIDAGTKLISGKKRSLTESTLTVESINSVESFGRPQSMRTAESVPDDDDLLSSILVGRKSSVFKMKPTPQFEVASRKRTRSAAKPSATKRKVLMDDTMVLHGDTIRQQLVNTEDIRRIRKKAPCTCSEISLIQRRFLEDEIFCESVLTGMSGDLTRLHSEQYDLSSVRISEGDENHASNEVAKDSGCSVRPDIAEGGTEGSSVPLINGNDEQAQSVGTTVHTKTQQGEYSDLNGGTTVHTETRQGEHSDLNPFFRRFFANYSRKNTTAVGGVNQGGSAMSSLLESCKLMDQSSSALSTVAIASAALSCEAARANLSAFDLTDSGDGSVSKEDIGVSSDIKVLLNGSKLAVSSNKGDDKVNTDSFSKIPVVYGNVREAVKSLHSVIRVVSNSGEKLGGKVLHLCFELRNLGEGSLERLRSNLGSVGVESLKSIFEKKCLSEESLRNGVKLAVEAGLEKDYVKLVKDVELVLGIVWKIVAWEAVTAFFVLEGVEFLNEKSGGKGGEFDGGNVKAEKKKKKKVLLGKGTSVIVEMIKDGLMSKGGGLEKIVEEFLSFLDPKSADFDGLLKKVKEILESNESRRIPKTPKGTRDFAKEQMTIRKKAFSIITKVFERHCATALDTPAFELKETLTGKYGEDSKLIYDLADQGGELCSLRYDLTVPFSRYVAMNGLTSFKRYHIDKVWRRDNPSKGRYREFYQCDFDIAGQYEKMGPDFEVVRILSEVLNALNIGDYEIKLNHRKLLDGVLEICGVPPAKFRTICSSIDKLDKQSFEQVKKEMVEEKGLSVETADKIGTFVKIRGPPLELLSKIMGGTEGSELLKHNASKEALGDLSILFDALYKSRCIDKVVFDLSLARGLDYYTGVIFEAAFKGGVQVGSIGAGGRYDNLIGNFGTKQVPAVGMSLGIERVLTIMEEKAQNQAVRATETQVLVAVLGDKLAVAAELVSELWDVDIKAEYKVHKKVMKHIEYAIDSKIPWMVIVGERELNEGIVKLKNIETTTEEAIPRSNLVGELQQRLKLNP